jgi:hypothetical protein
VHTNIYAAVEYRRKPHRPWAFLVRLPDVGAVLKLEALLGFGVHHEVRDALRLTLRGLPDDVADDSINEDAFTVDDAAAASDLGDLLDDVRFCTRQDAERWVASGIARFFSRGTMVTDPEALGASWATFQEFERLVSEFQEEHPGHVLRALLATMASLQADGFETRLIYWASK